MRSKTIERRPQSQQKPYVYPHPFKWVFQFEIALQGIKPPIWRRIQVPDCYTFWDLHCAITDSLGWLDYHLHMFTITNPKTGKPEQIGSPDDEGFDGPETLPCWEKVLPEYFTERTSTCDYLYDFGDDWHHWVILEKPLPREEGVIYPRCIDGARACPPEDVGGPPGYKQFLKSIAHLNAAEHDDVLKWVGGWFDPEWFDVSLVRFGDPKKRFGVAYCDKSVPKGMRMEQYHRLRGSH